MSYADQLLEAKRPVFTNPQQLIKAAADYFKWCEEHPLLEEKIFNGKDGIVRGDVQKMRPFTFKGLALRLGVSEGKLRRYKDQGDEWLEALEVIEQAMFTQKFEGAAAGLLNATIIGRDLGLAEKQELTGADGGPIETKETSVRERVTSRIASLAARVGDSSSTE